MSKSLAILIIIGIFSIISFNGWFGTLSDINVLDFWIEVWENTYYGE